MVLMSRVRVRNVFPRLRPARAVSQVRPELVGPMVAGGAPRWVVVAVGFLGGLVLVGLLVGVVVCS